MLMTTVLEGGADTGSMLLFDLDPAALPADYDSRTLRDPLEIVERLQAESDVIWRNP